MKLDTDVLTALSTAEVDGPHLRLTGQLDRSLYVKVNKALECLGGKWNKKAKAHIFDGEAAQAVESAILTGEVTDWKKELQFFPTPREIADRLVSLADLRGGMRVLEPSAGQGGILDALPGSFDDGLRVDICEINDAMRDLCQQSYGIEVVGVDFMDYDPGPIYDRVIANPPFTKQQDIKHVEHMMDLCKPGGRVVSVMSAGITFREDKRTQAFLERLEDHDYHIEPLDGGAFRASGTMVNTVIVTVDL